MAQGNKNNQKEQNYIEIHICFSQRKELLPICAHIICIHVHI